MSEDKNELRVLQFYLNKRIDSVDLKLDEIKDLLHEHLNQCEARMCRLDEKYDKRVIPLEQFRSRITGALILIGALISLWKVVM